MIIKANMLQSVGCEVATMMFVDGQVITVIGTPNSTVKILQIEGQPQTNCNKRFLDCFLYRKMCSITY